VKEVPKGAVARYYLYSKGEAERRATSQDGRTVLIPPNKESGSHLQRIESEEQPIGTKRNANPTGVPQNCFDQENSEKASMKGKGERGMKGKV